MENTKKTFITHAVKNIKTIFLSGEIYVTKEAFMKASKNVPNLKSISNEFKDNEIQRASSLGQHTPIKTTQKYYKRVAKDLK